MEEIAEPQRLLNISTNMLLELDTSGRILYANSKAVRRWNIQEHGKPRIIDSLDPISVSVFDNALNRVITEHHPYHFILTNQDRLYAAFLYPAISGRLSLCLEDITERHTLSIKQQRAARRLEFAERTDRNSVG